MRVIAWLFVFACGVVTGPSVDTSPPIETSTESSPPAPAPIESPTAAPAPAPAEAAVPAPSDAERLPPGPSSPPTSALPTGFEACPPPPETSGCTREHKPVCVAHADGTQSTGPNRCVGCLDAGAIGFAAGPCPE